MADYPALDLAQKTKRLSDLAYFLVDHRLGDPSSIRHAIADARQAMDDYVARLDEPPPL